MRNKFLPFLVVITCLFCFLSSSAQVPMYFAGTSIGTGGNSIPFIWTGTGVRGQQLYPVGVFGAPPTGMAISKIYFVSSSTGSQFYSNFDVKLKQANISLLTTTYEVGMTPVLTATNYTINRVANQWFVINLATPFPYDPALPLIWEVNQQSTGAAWYNLTTTAPAGAYRNYSAGYNAPSAAGAGLFMMSFGFDLIFSNKSPNDAGAEAIVEPTVGCVGVHPVKARIRNFGKNQIFSVVVNWSINGVNQTPVVHSSMLDTLNGTGPNTAIVNLGNLTTVNLASYNIAAWTSLPNGVVDTVISNNQANKTIIGAAYPVINLGANTTICPGTSLTLSAGSGLDSAKWSTSATGGSIVVTTAGNYKVTGFKNGCATKDSIVVGLFPPAPTVNIGKDTIICSNSSFVLNANTPGVSYLWQNNTTAPTQTVTTAGIYWVIITDVNGCKKGDTVDVDTLSPPKVLLIAKPGNNLCYGFPYSFEAKPFVKASKMFQWKINGINSGSPTLDSMFSPTLITKDSVSVDMLTDQCTTAVFPVTSNGVVMTIRPTPKLINGIIGTDVVKANITKNYGVGADPGHTYLWRVSGGTIIGDSTQTAVQIKWGGANPSASVTCRDKDQTNCVYPNVLPVVITSTIGIELIGEIELRPAYPNPADHTINIPVYSKNNSEIQLILIDITGKKVKDINSGVLTGEKVFTMGVSELSEGLYFYRITTSDGYESVRKITVQH